MSRIFGHRRLAIIDLSPAGHQPMHDPDTNNWISFNGEVYNYRQLRQDLQQKGQSFRTQTDTEVILKAYAVWGLGCVSRLRGMFAFGLWDAQLQRLCLVRDQLGVKPLYYWHDAHSFAFASEVRGLLASRLMPRHLEGQGLGAYLAYGSVQEPYTLIKGIRSLLPGHTLTHQRGEVHIDRYWQLPTPEPIKASPDLWAETGHRLIEAVESQLIADVPLGAFLSGGIDSTAIAALMKRANHGPVKTFSIVFDELAYDERAYSRLAAQQIGTTHTELLLRGEDVRDALPTALAAFDQPSMDGLNTYFIAKVTREVGLTVALSGVGGDELFGGYNAYYKPLLTERWGNHVQHLPPRLRQTLVRLLELLPTSERNRRAVDLLQTEYPPYFLSRQLFSSGQVSNLLRPELLSQCEGWQSSAFRGLPVETQGYDAINRASALELQTYMLSTLLRDSDQMSMAHALEIRVPLLDHQLVEFLFTLPGRYKVDPKHPKPLLTQPLSKSIPQACVYRPKRGFELPFKLWFQQSLHKEVASCFVEQSSDSAMPFSAQGLAQLWQMFERGQVSWSRVWAVFVLQHWLKRHHVIIS